MDAYAAFEPHSEHMPIQHTKSGEAAWRPLSEPGVKTAGVYVKVLRVDEVVGRAPTILLKFDPGASYPNHTHPGGEEVYVLDGEVRFGPTHLTAGDYLYTPPGGTHAVFSRTGCTMLLVVPEEVVILKA
jgi:quercetin dioxygenase-like cupin family protein